MNVWVMVILPWNLIAFLVCGKDKRQAKRHGQRVPERVLLGMAALGGSLGMLLGMLVFHHKTRKPGFMLGVPILLLIQITALYFLIY